MFSPSQEKKEGVNTDIYPTVWTFSIRKKNTASVLLLRNEKCGEREKLRSVLQQIQQKTKDLLCIRSCIYSSPHNSVTLSPPQGAPVAAWAQLPRVERGERYFVTHRGKRDHTLAVTIFIQGWFQEDSCPAFTGKAAVLVPYSDDQYFGCIRGADSHTSKSS